MPEISLSTGSGDYPPPPEPGVYSALAIEQVFRDMRFAVYDDNGRTEESQDLPGLQYIFALKDAGGTVHKVRSKPMKYFDRPHERSAMAKFFKSWLGELPSSTEGAVGQSALLTLETDPTNAYARITNITPLPQAMAAEVNTLRLALQPTAEAEAPVSKTAGDGNPPF
jgi:hypothetical protein